VHLQSIGHPIAGDPIYGGERRALNDADTPLLRRALTALKRQALHACVLGFVHPITSTLLTFSAPIPLDMQHVIDTLQEREEDS